MTPPSLFDPRSYELASIWPVIYLGTGAITGALVVLMLAKQPGSRLVRALALNLLPVVLLMVMLGGLWSTPYPEVANQLVRPGLALLSFTGPLQVLFTTRASGFDVRVSWRRFRDLGFGIAAAFMVLVLASNLVIAGPLRVPYGFHAQPAPLYPAYLLFYGTYWLASLYPLAVAARSARFTMARRRAKYLLLAYAIGGLAVVDTLMMYGVRIPPASWIAALTATLILSYAVVQHRIMDFSTAVHRTGIRVLISLLLFAPVYAFMTFLRETLAARGPAEIAALLAALFLLARAYFARVEPWLDRVLARRRLRLEHAVEAFAARAAELISHAELVDDVVATVRRLLGAETRAIVLRSEQGWRPLYPRGPLEPDATKSFAQDASELFETLRAAPEVIALSELGAPRFEVIERSAQRLCDRYGAAAILPLVHHGEFAGAIAIGPLPRERAFTHDESDFLERLRTAATVAFVNAQLFEDTERRAATLEEEVRARTAQLSQKLHGLKHAQAELVQSEKMASLGMLVAGVSHEINNALTFVYGNLPTLRKYLGAYEAVLGAYREAARDAPAGPELDQACTGARYDFIRSDTEPLLLAMEEGARRARKIVTDLRSFARHDEAVVALADVRDGLESTLNLLCGGFGTRIQFHREYADPLPRIECHPAQLNQMFLNLLLNAAEAIEDRGDIWVRAQPSSRGGVVVTIRDSGRGIEDRLLPRVWEPFFTTKPPGGGSGLGLTICRTIVERHGGHIAIASGPARGTSVSVELPHKAAGAGAQAGAAS